ncbi:hypothetical protein BC628DRAFT_1351401 [Trametes gibbosa]|nr:hypothetical protein BC628DRAFT_1351401 [Trametes gibbosa]
MSGAGVGAHRAWSLILLIKSVGNSQYLQRCAAQATGPAVVGERANARELVPERSREVDSWARVRGAMDQSEGDKCVVLLHIPELGAWDIARESSWWL